MSSPVALADEPATEIYMLMPRAQRFRWAVCQLDTMKKCLTPAAVRAELKRMPETLDQTYDRMLQCVPRQHQPFVRSALTWLAFSAQPLTLQELAEAAVIDPKSGRFDADHRLINDDLILQLCGSLVSVSKLNYAPEWEDWLRDKVNREHGWSFPYSGRLQVFDVVSLSHYSMKEYIASERLREGSLSYYYASKGFANTFLAQCCLLYLLEFNSGEIIAELTFDEYPLLGYAAKFWIGHWKERENGSENPVLRVQLTSLFDPSTTREYVNWLNVYNPDSAYLDYRIQLDVVLSPGMMRPQSLYWAAWIGDLQIVTDLVLRGADISKKEGLFGSALSAAAYHGHFEVVDYLLGQGADANLATTEMGSVLQVAALGGSLKVVQRVIAAGADINAQGGPYNTALVAAASKEHVDVVALLVKHGADINIGSWSHGSSLYQAASAGDVRTVVILLAAGADVNEIGDSDGTGLYTAALSGSLPLVQMLLRKGADTNKGGRGEFGYPIVAAASKGHGQIVRSLLRAGADANLSGPWQRTALGVAIGSRDLPTFRALLDAGADVNNPGSLYMNCFHGAIYTGELEMAKILLQHGAKVEEEGFLEAVKRHDSHPWFLEAILERHPDVNVNAWTKDHGSALHIAIDEKDEVATRLLLERNAYINAMSDKGSVLTAAIDRGMVSLAKELISRGANVNRESKGDTPFAAAISYSCGSGNGDMGLADTLLAKGADINAGGGIA